MAGPTKKVLEKGERMSECKNPYCGNQSLAKGWCMRCYRLALRNGVTTTNPDVPSYRANSDDAGNITMSPTRFRTLLSAMRTSFLSRDEFIFQNQIAESELEYIEAEVGRKFGEV